MRNSKSNDGFVNGLITFSLSDVTISEKKNSKEKIN